jgi:hypothetical protein
VQAEVEIAQAAAVTRLAEEVAQAVARLGTVEASVSGLCVVCRRRPCLLGACLLWVFGPVCVC